MISVLRWIQSIAETFLEIHYAATFNLGNREAGATRFSPMSLPLYFDGGAVQLKV